VLALLLERIYRADRRAALDSQRRPAHQRRPFLHPVNLDGLDASLQEDAVFVVLDSVDRVVLVRREKGYLRDDILGEEELTGVKRDSAISRRQDLDVQVCRPSVVPAGEDERESCATVLVRRLNASQKGRVIRRLRFRRSPKTPSSRTSSTSSGRSSSEPASSASRRPSPTEPAGRRTKRTWRRTSMDLALIEWHARWRTACTCRTTESRTVEVPRVMSFAIRSLQSTSSLKISTRSSVPEYEQEESLPRRRRTRQRAIELGALRQARSQPDCARARATRTGPGQDSQGAASRRRRPYTAVRTAPLSDPLRCSLGWLGSECRMVLAVVSGGDVG
jgi:hypothetical protein